jgi:hypothetical protein
VRDTGPALLCSCPKKWLVSSDWPNCFITSNHYWLQRVPHPNCAKFCGVTAPMTYRNNQ